MAKKDIIMGTIGVLFIGACSYVMGLISGCDIGKEVTEEKYNDPSALFKKVKEVQKKTWEKIQIQKQEIDETQKNFESLKKVLELRVPELKNASAAISVKMTEYSAYQDARRPQMVSQKNVTGNSAIGMAYRTIFKTRLIG